MSRDMALAGGAALAAGLFLGLMVEHLRRLARAPATMRSVPAPPRAARARDARSATSREETSTDLLERYRAMAAF
jgi:hypothetical protein